MRTGIVTPTFMLPPMTDPDVDHAINQLARHLVSYVTRLARAVDFNESRVIVTDQALPTPVSEDRGLLRLTKETGASGEDELYICRYGTGASLVWDKIL